MTNKDRIDFLLRDMENKIIGVNHACKDIESVIREVQSLIPKGHAYGLYVAKKLDLLLNTSPLFKQNERKVG